ncbi:hypothetical protein L596_026980 [Steinernema carpocapsae]|uniref:UBC core domain-containing protein n=1 Tax=Steinernema carpocapsae TaxID=34508 RepID=A0A4V5ZYB8_STECR|nr:hypothetical protein L596_026980 [Steinernema carpocapsae]
MSLVPRRKMGSSSIRVRTELRAFLQQPPPGMLLDPEHIEQNSNEWIVSVEAAKDTIYEGEKYKLRVRFPTDYPFKPPEVVFIGDCIPENPHVYSNGHICISILGSAWSPALDISAVCLSIISMLSSCKKKERPPHDSEYVRVYKKVDYRFFDGTYNDAKC